MFGKNVFGDPIFKIVWGQSQFIRLGNLWRDSRGNERIGFKERYQCHGMPCWVIMRWFPPAHYGSPRLFYSQTYDSFTKLHFMGEYPWRGRYEIVQPLISKEYVSGKLVVTHFPLSHVLIDAVIPVMIAYQKLSLEQLMAAQAANKAIEEKKQTEFIADLLEEGMPRFWGPVSYSKQGIRTSLLDRKMAQIERVWNAMTRGGRKPRFSRGMSMKPRIE
jgi:hypothetical protein